MQRISQGDADAVRPLVERHHAGLLAYLYRLGEGDRGLAEDLAQETFLRVVRDRTYRPGAPFQPWLFAIATNLVRDHHRRQARRPASAGESELAGMASDVGDPEATAVGREESRRVAAAIQSLPIEFRSVLLMRFFHDMPLAAVATALDVPLGTVKSRLHTGVRRLRELLVEEPEKAL